MRRVGARRAGLTAQGALVALLAATAALAACGGEPGPGSGDAGQGDAASVDVASSTSDELTGLTWLMRAREASAAAGGWPASGVWPGFKLHQAPTVLAVLDARGMPSRAFAVAWPTAIDGATEVSLPGGATDVVRHDPLAGDLGPGERVIPAMTVAGVQALVVTWSPYRDTDELRWVETLGRGYLRRLRETEARWSAVEACGQVRYPRFEQAIALLMLECAVLQEGLSAKDPGAAKARLHEWLAIRQAAIAVTGFVGQRVRHYDNIFGAERFVAGRLTVAANLRSHEAWREHLRTWLSGVREGPVTEFDGQVLEAGEIGAAAMEIAALAGWDVEPSFRQGHNVMELVTAQLGPASSGQVAAAKARHDWQAFVARAKAIMALPVGGAP